MTAIRRDAGAVRAKGRRRGSREEAALDALLERIHAVNPTGRALSRQRERALYEEKSRLQSRLVEEFGHRIDVRAHDEMPGVVGLSVPSLERSAGHAILDDLSVRARDVLEPRLSAEEAGTRPEHARRRRSRDENDIERAQRFIDEYDFESAEQLLRERIAGPEADAPRAMDVLILLYAEHLGRDDDALRVAEVRRHPVTSSESRRALGLAATRTGRRSVGTGSSSSARSRSSRRREARPIGSPRSGPSPPWSPCDLSCRQRSSPSWMARAAR